MLKPGVCELVADVDVLDEATPVVDDVIEEKLLELKVLDGCDLVCVDDWVFEVEVRLEDSVLVFAEDELVL